jgi:hypothetical protein
MDQLMTQVPSGVRWCDLVRVGRLPVRGLTAPPVEHQWSRHGRGTEPFATTRSTCVRKRTGDPGAMDWEMMLPQGSGDDSSRMRPGRRLVSRKRYFANELCKPVTRGTCTKIRGCARPSGAATDEIERRGGPPDRTPPLSDGANHDTHTPRSTKKATKAPATVRILPSAILT